MKTSKTLIFLAFVGLVTLSCQWAYSLFPGLPTSTAAPTSTPLPPTALPSRTQTETPSSTPTPNTTPTLVLPPAGLTPTPKDSEFILRIHPDTGIYVGDQVSFEVIAPVAMDLTDKFAVVTLQGEAPLQLGRAGFGRYGIGGRRQATLLWTWDTSGLEPGSYTLEVSVDPNGPRFFQNVNLLARDELAYPEPEASWANLEIGCCVLHYITGTEAERDLENLAIQVEEQAQLAQQRMGVSLMEPVDIVFLPRLLGHGGFAGGEIHISYLDRSPTSSDVMMIIHHELIHILDHRREIEYRPSLFAEGLATYLTGGHYKPEPVFDRAAAALQAGQYLPLEPLADDFYPSQHELGYLQAAGLIDYMVQTWGYPAFDTFYRSIPRPGQGQEPSDVIDQALQANYSMSLPALEAGYLAALEAWPEQPGLQQDVLLSVAAFDTLRRYQSLMDGSAYYLTAWLPPSSIMRERGILADYLRRPDSAEHVALELLLGQVTLALNQAQYAEAWPYLDAANRVMDGLETNDPAAFYLSPLAADALALVHAARSNGLEPQRLEISGEQAVVFGWQEESRVIERAVFTRKPEGWTISAP